MIIQHEFSARTRETALKRFQKEEFDLLIIGGGITGAGVARDAASRGLKVALVERRDFAWGTSSRSSKLIHGGLRYLQNFEMRLVFEALAERAHLLKTSPNLVRPLPFYLPVYKSDSHGRALLSTGLWLYDVLALFRTPGFHRHLSKRRLLKAIPFLKGEGLKGGFKYYDASMWDDLLTVDTLRSAQALGASVANYVEAVSPVWEGERIAGFKVRDLESKTQTEINVRAKRVVVCAGPWTDEVGERLSAQWKPWLSPSKGIHLIFDLKRLSLPGAMVMNHPDDGRISFVIPRPDFGPGLAIVGTTDGPTSANPDEADVSSADVEYLLDLLNRYFPALSLTSADIISAYVGVRPLMAPGNGDSESLQKVSREHYIGEGPGQTVVAAGGKYTTHRTMAAEIVDYTLEHWKKSAKSGQAPALPKSVGGSKTLEPVNPNSTGEALEEVSKTIKAKKLQIPAKLLERYGADALEVFNLHQELLAHQALKMPPDPEGFPYLGAQFLYALQKEMVVHLEDFYLRRQPLFLSRKDLGLPWAEGLARIWARHHRLPDSEIAPEIKRLQEELDRRSNWKKAFPLAPLSETA